MWSQIAEAISGDISSGAMPAGFRLPTEAQLAARYGVNRHTIRRALEELGDARIIRTEHGRGSFVAEEVMDYRIGKRPRFSEWVRGHSRTPIGEIIDLQEATLGDVPEESCCWNGWGRRMSGRWPWRGIFFRRRWRQD